MVDNNVKGATVSRSHSTHELVLFLFLTKNGKWAHYPELSDGQTETLDVAVDVEFALKGKPIHLHFVLLHQLFQTLRETKSLHWQWTNVSQRDRCWECVLWILSP